MRKYLILILALFSFITTKATHTAGMDIFYRWVSDSTYQFTVIFYRNCDGFTATAPPSVSLRSASASLGLNPSNPNVTLPRLQYQGSNVPPLQPPNMYNCTKATNLCYEEYYYRGNWTSRGRATDWVFSTTICCRPGGTKGPANIINPGAVEQWIECGLNNKDFPDGTAKNWSPIWHNRRPNHPGYTTDTIVNYLFRTLCAGNYYTLDMSCKEYQGDSLSYSMSIPQGANGTNIPYNTGAGWSFLNPMPILPAYPTGKLQINPVTGIIPITPGNPTGTGIYALGLKCTEWRNDTIVSGGSFATVKKEIGWVKRDMTIWIDPPSTCRHDSVHVENKTLTDGCGDTTITVTFHNGVSTDPNSLVRCNTISKDGSEFRLLDSSTYVYPFDSTVKSIGVHRAEWECRSGVTDEITLYLAEGLECKEYTLLLKTGTDLDVLESECGFLEPEWSYGKITMDCPVEVTIDTSDKIGICLPDQFPKIKASSPDSALQWFWVVNGDTSQNNGYYHNVPYIWTKDGGTYKVSVIDEYGCVGDDQIEVYFDNDTSFFLENPLYCDLYGEQRGMPKYLVAPFVEGDGEWSWEAVGLGTVGTGDTLNLPIEGLTYVLHYTKKPISSGLKGCESTYIFHFNRDSMPPQDPLWIDIIPEEYQLCLSDDDSLKIQVWDKGVREKYSPLSVDWYYDSITIPNDKFYLFTTKPGTYKIHVTDSLGCWGEDTIRVTSDERLAGPKVPCRINRNGQGVFSINWPNDIGSLIVSNEISYDGGNTWIPASGGNEHVVNNIQAQKFILARGVVNSSCKYTVESISNECPNVVYPPNVITPNGDGLNDVFDVTGLELYENSEISIYDRWGNLVYESDNYKNNWDGGEYPEGVYYYIIKVDDPRNTIHKGAVTILR